MGERREHEREESFLKLLKSLEMLTSLEVAGERSSPPLGVVGRIAAWIDSPRVLQAICNNFDWFGNWQIKEALLRNPFTPAGPRADLERQIAVFDLLRELDSSHLSAEDRQEIREDVRGLLATLNPSARDAVKARALELSSSRNLARKPPLVEAPAPEAPAPEAPASEVPAQEPSAQESSEEEQSLPQAPEEVPSDPALPGQVSTETPVETVAEEIPLEELAFSFPEPVYEELGTGEFVLQDLWASVAEHIPGDLNQPLKVDPKSPEAVAARRQPLVPPVLEIEDIDVPEVEEPASTVADSVSARHRADLETARFSSDAKVLSALAQRSVEDLQLALLENFALPELAAASLARRASATVADRIYRSRRWFSRPRIREALLECPAAPAAAQLEALGSLRDFGKILRVLSSPRIRHLEVKAKARSRLRGLFQTLSQGEKLAAVRSGGRRMLQQLWTDFFRDEPLVLRCLREKRLDEGTVLEIARSKIAPRRALEQIGSTAAWVASYPIRLALVKNPKTPRPVAARLLQKLKPADRKMIRKNMAISAALRNQA